MSTYIKLDMFHPSYLEDLNKCGLHHRKTWPQASCGPETGPEGNETICFVKVAKVTQDFLRSLSEGAEVVTYSSVISRINQPDWRLDV